MKFLKKGILVFSILFLIAQFFGPDINEGKMSSIAYFEAETIPPENVKLILKNSCYDCHSDVTKYPWYNSVTPINYWIDNHINHGKKHFNVSNWEGNSVKRKDHKFEKLIQTVKESVMPLKSYTWMHEEAELNQDEIKALVDWANQVRFKYSLLPKPE